MIGHRLRWLQRVLPRYPRREVLVLGFPRRTLHEGAYWDIYVDPILAELALDHLIIERPYHGHTQPVPNRPIRYLDGIYLLRALKRRMGMRSARSDRRLIHRYLAFVVAQVDPRVIFLNGVHPCGILIDVARERSIPTIFFQQGRGGIPPDADYVLTTGAYFTEAIADTEQTVITTGYPFIERFAEIPTQPGLICVIEGKQRTSRVFGLAEALSAEHPASEVVYVPHPHRRWTDRYDTDTDLTVFREADVYDLIARAEVVIGEVSTVLIEAAFLGADVFVWSSEHPLAQHFPQFGDRAELRAMMQDERPTVPTVEFIRPGGLERQRAAIAEIFRREGIDGLC